MRVEIDKDKTQDHWLEVVVKDDMGGIWAEAQLKWDGCVHYTKYMNEPKGDKRDPENMDYLHVCSLRQLIEELQEMEKLALEHFAGADIQYWPQPPGATDSNND